jgi:hypothetical protein
MQIEFKVWDCGSFFVCQYLPSYMQTQADTSIEGAESFLYIPIYCSNIEMAKFVV